MKTFKLSIFKGHELKQEKEVTVNSREELKAQKYAFWNESASIGPDPKLSGVFNISDFISRSTSFSANSVAGMNLPPPAHRWGHLKQKL